MWFTLAGHRQKESYESSLGTRGLDFWVGLKSYRGEREIEEIAQDYMGKEKLDEEMKQKYFIKAQLKGGRILISTRWPTAKNSQGPKAGKRQARER